MGAFFYVPPGLEPPPEALRIFQRKGFSPPEVLKAGTGSMLYYRKQWASGAGVLTADGCTVVAPGTCIYRGRTPSGSLRSALEDFLRGTLDPLAFRGIFVAFFLRGETVFYLPDRVGQYPVYHHGETGFVSSSFLAVLAGASGLRGRLPLDRDAVLQTLLTGNLLGPETLVTGIRRLMPVSGGSLPGMQPIPLPVQDPGGPPPTGREPLVERQLQKLRDLFHASRELLKEHGAVSGLTGGLDSRLLALLLREAAPSRRFYFNTENPDSRETRIVKGFAREAGETLDVLVVRPTGALDPGELGELLDDGFHLWDGCCRIHQVWLEERKGRAHLKRLFGQGPVGLSGVGGERFRNHDGLTSPGYPMEDWLKSEVMLPLPRNPFPDPRAEREFRQGFARRVRGLLGMAPHERSVALREVRKFYDTLYYASNRACRHGIENQLTHSWAPFGEPDLSVTGFLRQGRHMEFQLELLRRLDPGLARCPLAYGFRPDRSVPLRIRMLPLMKRRGLLPLTRRILPVLRSGGGANAEGLAAPHPLLEECLGRVRELRLPLDVDILAENPLSAPLAVELGVFLWKMEDCLALG